MVEPIMFFGIGFLVASLIGLVIVPLVHNRAVRLTIRRVEAATPLSMAEIQADKDQLRAEFAISTRRQEMSIDQLKTKTTRQLAEIGKKTDAINRLKIELGEKVAAIFALEAREKLLKDQVRAHEDDVEVKTAALRELERTLAERDAELAKTSNALADRSTLADSQRVELAALNAQLDAYKSRLDDAERAGRGTEDRLGKTRAEADATAKHLGVERGKVENLGARVADLERQLIAQSTETELQVRRGTNLEQQLERASEETVRVQAELSALKREAEGSWQAERAENALLRERINDIAAEVAQLAVALEGPGSPIEAILAEGKNGPNGHGTAKSQDGGSLADRIRALQARASRSRQ
jgi:chromosome segregation ATPase